MNKKLFLTSALLTILHIILFISCASGEAITSSPVRPESPLVLRLDFADEDVITHTPKSGNNNNVGNNDITNPLPPLITTQNDDKNDNIYENIKVEAEKIRTNQQKVKNTPIDKNRLLLEQLELNTKSITDKSDFYNAIVEYTFIDGKIYDIISSPYSVTDIRLEKSERILGNVAIGEPTEWLIETTESEENGERIVHFLVKAEHESGSTTVIVPTTKRTYYFRLTATSEKAMVGCRFVYPKTTKKTFSLSSSSNWGTTPNDTLINASEMDLNYIILGEHLWGPNLVFSDTRRTVIQFPPSFITSSDAPSLYIKKGNDLGLINYIIKGNLYITDTLINDEESFMLIKNNESIEIQRSYE